MADDASPQMPQQPQPPPGFQRPGVPGAGNLLDPEVRGQVRESLHSAAQQARGKQEAAPEAAPQAEQPQPAPRCRAGPYPHGDVDLSFIAANVPAEPVRPRRGKTGRRFYFLPEPAPASDAANAPAVPPPAGPKPG